MRIMQCWDDGDVDDIRLVGILRKHGARATFNINPGGWKSERRVAHRYKGEYTVYRLTLDECHFLASNFWEKFKAVKAIDGDFYFRGHTFELMGDEARWQDLDAMIRRLSDDPATEWTDVRELFIK